jgi:small subunit ribosomal protein S15
MELIKTEKTQIIEAFKTHEGDTGSSEIQIAILTERIKRLTGHMSGSRHDFITQRGLLKLVGQRRRLLKYLASENVDRYHLVLSELGLRK